MRIFLIGMPGSGKTTYGKKLALRFDSPFIDLDKAIIEKEQDAIATIFESRGEAYFRKLESSVLKDAAAVNEHFILATGGGTPCFFDNLEYMKEQGKVIFIKVSIDILVERLKNEKERPLLKSKAELENSLKELSSKRGPIYEQAHFIVEGYEELERLAENL